MRLAALAGLPILAGSCVSAPTPLHTVAHSPLPAPTLRDGQPLGAGAAVAARIGGVLGEGPAEGGAHMTVAGRQGGGEFRLALGDTADVGVYAEDLGGRIAGDATPRPRPPADGHLIGVNLAVSIPLGEPGLRLAGWADVASAAVSVRVFDLLYGGASEERESAARVAGGALLSYRRGAITGFGGVSGSQMFTGFTREVTYDASTIDAVGVWTLHAGVGAEVARGARLNVVAWGLAPGQRIGLGPCGAVELVVPLR